MATNPMQRKARIAFFLGMFTTLLICGVIIFLLFLQIKNYKEKEAKNIEELKEVYVLKENVKSGAPLTPSMYQKMSVKKSMIPETAVNVSILNAYALQDKQGFPVRTLKDETGKTITDEDGNAKRFIERDGENYEVLEEKDIPDSYYIVVGGVKTTLELNVVPVVAKIDLKKNMILTEEVLARGKDSYADDVRRQEYNVFVLPMDLATGDYVDIRLMLPSGEDLIVASKKMVEIPEIGTETSSNTIWLNVGEDDILTISSAIIDAYQMQGSKLYVTKYTDPGIQKDATPTYVASNDVIKIINKDPNILAKASSELVKRYNSIGHQEIRNDHIDKVIYSTPEEERKENIKTKMNESINITQDTRRRYLDSMGGNE